MKQLSTILVALLISGCALHKDAIMVPDIKNAKWTNSSCGYFDNALHFGQKNCATIKKDSMYIELCSTAYYSRLVAGGLIIPLFPIFGKKAYLSPSRWIRLTNLDSNGVISIQSDFTKRPDDLDAILFSTNRSYGYKDALLSNFDNSKIQLTAGNHVWIGLPNTNMYPIVIHTQNQKHEFLMKTARSWSWFMLMH